MGEFVMSTLFSTRTIGLACAVAGGVALGWPVGADAQIAKEFAIATTPTSFPWGITSGPDGALWFTERFADKIGRITTAGAVTEFPIPTSPGGPALIVSGPSGKLC